MPIEFRCSHCQKLLRTPDESAGRKAKCPDCGAIVDVPAGAAAGAAQGGVSLGKPQEDNPFTETRQSPARPLDAAFDDGGNPYASAPVKPPAAALGEPIGSGELRHGSVTFSDAWEITWERFSAHAGPLLLSGLVYFALIMGMVFAAYIVLIAGAVGVAAAFGPNQEPSAAVIVLLGAIAVVLFFLAILLPICWLTAGMFKLAVMTARGYEPAVSVIFQGGSAMFRVLGIQLFLGLIMLPFILVPAGIFAGVGAMGGEEGAMLGGMSGVFLGIALAIPVMVATCLAPLFAVDRQEGVISSLMLSWRFMKGNMLATFLYMLVVQVLAQVVGQLTCGIGAIATTPYVFLAMAVVYCLATGQIVASKPLPGHHSAGYNPAAPTDNPFA
jgi:hypothetical protein